MVVDSVAFCNFPQWDDQSILYYGGRQCNVRNSVPFNLTSWGLGPLKSLSRDNLA